MKKAWDKRVFSSLLLFITLIIFLAGCSPPVEVVRIEVTAPAGAGSIATREIEVTREVLVTPPGAGTAIPGPGLMASPAVVTVTVPVTVTVMPAAEVEGSSERTVHLWFPPQVPTGVLAARGPALLAWLAQETGRTFTIEHAESMHELVDALCSAPAETAGFVPATAYLLAQEQCNVQPAGVAVQDGVSYQMGMIVVRTNSGFQSLADLEGLDWAIPEDNSLTRDLAVQAMLSAADVNPGDSRTFNGDNGALLALLDGEVDFATATFTPPVLPYNERIWEYDVDDPEEWRFLGITPERHPQGYIVVITDPESGGYRIRDARAGIFDVNPAVFSQTRILAVTPPIPQEALVFGPDFPIAAAEEIKNALIAYAGGTACRESLCAADFYGWQGMQAVDDKVYDEWRDVVAELNLTDRDLWELVEP